MPTNDLHAISGSNEFCAPAAIASLLNITTDEAAARITRITRQHNKVRAVNRDVYTQVLREAGLKLTPVTLSKRQTIVYWMVTTTMRGRFLLRSNGHVMTADTRNQTLCDNHSKVPVYVRTHRNKRRFIAHLWLVETTDGAND